MRTHAIVVLAFALLSGCTTTMRISRGELQADVAKRFPVEADKQVVRITASNPHLEFPGDPDVLGVRLDLAATSASGNSQLSGTTRVEGRLEYVRAQHAFFLREPKVTELDLHPPEGVGSLARVVDGANHAFGRKLIERAARSAVEELLRTHPIYRLEARRSKKEARAIRHLRSVRIDGQDLVIEVGL